MTQLKLLTAGQLERLIRSIGFVKTRQKGSHAFYKHPDGRTTTIPHHSNRDLPRPLIRAILREIRLSVDKYNEFLSK